MNPGISYNSHRRSKNMQTIISKHVQTVLVTDPDTGGICEVEIRKEHGSNALVGIDGAWLDDDLAPNQPLLSPYGNGEIVIPDNEDAIDPNADHLPHHVVINYGDGVNVGVYHYPNKALARQHVMEFVGERFDNIHDEDDDGVEFSVKIERAVNEGAIENALALFHQVPDNLESISYSRTTVLAETPLKTKR